MIGKIVVTLDGIDYTLPDEISVTEYAELMRRMNMSETELEKTIDLISVLLKIPYHQIFDIDIENILKISNLLQDIVNENNIEYQKKFRFKGVKYGGLNLMKMTFGEYIDLVSYIKNDIYIYKNIHKICAILYRPIIEEDGDNFKIAKYDLDEFELQQELFKELPVKYFFGALNNLYSYLFQIRKDFVVLFGEDRNDLPDDLKKESKNDDDNNLPWYRMIMALSDDDFTKINYVTSRPAIECFNHLTYLIIKGEEMKQQQLEYQNKMNLLK